MVRRHLVEWRIKYKGLDYNHFFDEVQKLPEVDRKCAAALWTLGRTTDEADYDAARLLNVVHGISCLEQYEDTKRLLDSDLYSKKDVEVINHAASPYSRD